MKTFRKRFGRFTCEAKLRQIDGKPSLVFEWEPVPQRGQLNLDAYRHWRDTVVVPAIMADIGARNALVIDL